MNLKRGSLNYKKLFSIVILSLMLFSVLGFVLAAPENGDVGTSGTSTGGDTIGTYVKNQLNVNTGEGNLPQTNAILDKEITAKVSLWISTFLNLGTTYKEFIMGLIVMLIVIAGLYDLLTLTSLFQGKFVKVIIAVGLGVIMALSTLLYQFTLFLLRIAATFGAIGVVIEIIVAIVVFVGISVGSVPLATLAAKRYAAQSAIKAIKGGSNVAGGIKILKDVFKEGTKGK